MEYIIRDYKVNELPEKGVPNSRYYVQSGDIVLEYITDKYGNLKQVGGSSSGSVTSISTIDGVGISSSVDTPDSTPVIHITNTSPDQIVTLSEGSNITITGTYPDFTINASGSLDSNWTLSGDDISNANIGNVIINGLIFPTVDGSNGQSLITDGAGNLSFSDISVSETDPVYTSSSWYTTTNNSSNWDTSYGWGDHALIGYLTSISGLNISLLTNDAGYLTAAVVSETDPLYLSSSWASTTNNSIDWDEAYGWGDHASAGYITSLELIPYLTSADADLTYYPLSNPSGYTNNIGTVSSVAALTLGTTGTDLSSTVLDGTTTPVITLNIPTASATNRGALSSSDWTTFNSKQPLDSTLTALAGLATGANKIPYSTGTDTFDQLDFSTSTSLGTSDTTIPSQNAIKTYVDNKGYTLAFTGLSSTLTNGNTFYAGAIPKTFSTTSGAFRVYIPKSGTITRADVVLHSGSAGTSENIVMSIRLNATTDTALATVGVVATTRVFTNSSLNITVIAGDYIELKIVCPTWATPPTTTGLSGTVWIQ